MKIFLIRHGQTTDDVEDRYGGDHDDHLTHLGKDQTQKLADTLADKGIEMIFVSPRFRAQETAAILTEKISTPIKVLEDLRERNHYGVLSGMVKAEAKEKFPDDVEKIKSHLTHATGGEDYQIFLARINNVLQEVFRSEKQIVAVVTHGQFIKAIFRDILKLGEVAIEDCGFAEIEEMNGNLKVLSLSGISPK